MDGGDVLYTGREFFVGKTERTNLAGISALAAAFPNFKVTAIDITEIGSKFGILHLKSACSMCGDSHVLAGGEVGLFIIEAIKSASPQVYRFTHVPDASASNCVFVNGHLLRRCDSEFPQSASVLKAIGGKQIEVKGSELAKVDGALTCCSVLF